MYAVNFTELLSNGTVESDPSWPLQSCKNGWEYNFTDIPYSTVATELDWVCDDDFLPSLAQAIFFIGAICGGLLFGYVADRYGRIPALAGCNLMGFVAGNSSGNNLIRFNIFLNFPLTSIYRRRYRVHRKLLAVQPLSLSCRICLRQLFHDDVHFG